MIGILAPAVQVVSQFQGARQASDAVVQGSFQQSLAFGILPYLAVTVAGVAIAVTRGRLLVALPALVFLIVGYVSGDLSATGGALSNWPSDDPLRYAWGFSLALIPALVASLFASRPTEWEVSPPVTSAAAAGTAALVGMAIAVVLVVRGALFGWAILDGVDRFAIVVVTAAIISSLRWWIFLWMVPIVILLAPELWPFLVPGSSSLRSSLDAPFLLASAGIAFGWRTYSRPLDSFHRSPRQLLFAVVALNTLDAVLTELVVATGRGEELNPLVTIIGLPIKLVVVPIVAWLIYRVRPGALFIPALALGGVLCWHLGGALINI